jgi:hypothetical protein
MMKYQNRKKFQINKGVMITAVLFSLLLYSIAPAALLPGASLVQAAESGTESEPIQIDSVQELKDIATGLDKHYVLTKDIELDVASYWKPIGTATSPFTGTLDGQGHKINNLMINVPINNLGLFAFISNAKIQNLTLENVSIQGESYAAALASQASGTCEITNCSVTGLVTGVSYIGGLVGYYSGTGNIENSSMSGEISSSNGSLVGGLVGYFYATGKIENSYMSGEVNAGGDNVGGLAGCFSGTGKMENCYMSGEVNAGGSYTGGLVGLLNNSNILQSYNMSNITSKGIGIGGIIGHLNGGTAIIEDSFNSGTVTGSSYVGGVLGYQSSGSTEIATVFNSGTVIGSADYIGGIVGYIAQKCAIKESANLGVVSGRSYVGGIAGYFYSTLEVLNSYNRGNISGTGQGIGGIVGYYQQTAGNGIRYCYSTGDIKAATYVGGLVGQIYSGSIIHSVAMNDSVTATSTGGYRVIGYARSLTASGNLAFEDMVVTVKGTVRSIKSGNPGHNSMDGMNGKKSTVMQNDSYLALLDWDFQNIWQLKEGGNDYPTLRNLNLTPPALNVSVKDVSLDKSTKTIMVGETVLLKATIAPTDATNQELTWTSNYPDIAKVTNHGVITAQSAGSAIVTVKTIDGGFTANCEITVVESTGTADDPILIRTVSGLKAIANGLDKHYVLTDDIDLGENAEWKPIGRSTAPFTGSLDGNGYKIKNLSTASLTSYFGIFAYATNANIKNLTLENVAISGTDHIAAVAAVAAGTTEISNCSITGLVQGTSNFVGGLVSYMTGESKLVNCQMDGKVTGLNYVGGLVGRLNGGEIRQSQNLAEVTASGKYCGTIAGMTDPNGKIIEFEDTVE